MIAHELTHVVQQNGSVVQREGAAEALQRKPFAGTLTQPVLRESGETIQRFMGRVADHSNVDLNEHEQAGGHTIARHVGKNAEFIRNRVIDQELDAASTFPDLQTAQIVVTEAIKYWHTQINDVLFSPAGGPANKAWQYDAKKQVGSYLEHGNVLDKKGRQRDPKALKSGATRVTLVLHFNWQVNWQPGRPHNFYVLTCYPLPPE